MFLKYKNDNQVFSLHNDLLRSYLCLNNQIIAVRNHNLVPNKSQHHLSEIWRRLAVFHLSRPGYRLSRSGHSQIWPLELLKMTFEHVPVGTLNVPVRTFNIPVGTFTRDQFYLKSAIWSRSGHAQSRSEHRLSTSKKTQLSLAFFMKVIDMSLRFSENFE